MYKKIVIPLDGSDLAEQALAYLNEIKKDNPRVMLVSVTEHIAGQVPAKEIFEPFVSEHEVVKPPPLFYMLPPGMIVPSYVPDMTIDYGSHEIPIPVGKMAATAENYLRRIAEELEEQGFNVTTNVLIGNPADEIIGFAEEQKADLIVMASTGKPGIKRWDMSNIAEKVIRNAKISVMLVKPAPGFVETKRKRKGVPS
ncbi:MAG: universal stress protein [Dehalococcoidales bacterium]|nr:universal stress protein [Dehalococcoidales bacterium]